MWQDYANAAWETLGCVVLFGSMVQLRRDQGSRGIHWSHVIYFIGISMWFCYFYVHLEQWWSLAVQALYTAETIAWAGMMVYYFAKRGEMHD